MKITIITICTMLILSGIILIPNAFADVPDWVKNTAGWWATDDKISETEFVNAMWNF